MRPYTTLIAYEPYRLPELELSSSPCSYPTQQSRAIPHRALWFTTRSQIAALRSGEHAPLPAAPGQLGDGDLSPPNQMVALACMCSSPVIVDARKRTKVERPGSDASDVRLVQRQRSSVPTNSP